MPRSTTPIWMLTFGLLLGSPFLNAVYWERLLVSDVLPHDGDAIAIPIFAGLLVALIAAPFVIGVTWYCLRNYNRQTKVLAWRSDRPIRSLLATVIFGGAAGSLIVFLASDVRDMFRDYPWRNFTFTLLLPPAIAWCLAMRAAFIERIELPLTAGRDDTASWGPREHHS